MKLKEIRLGEGGDWQIIGADGKLVYANADRQECKRKWQELLLTPEQPKGKEVNNGAS